MSPEIYSSGYEIDFRTLSGEVESDHRAAKKFIDIANDFLRGMNRRFRSKDYFFKNSAITALSNFLPRNIAESFIQDIIDGKYQAVRFTRDKDSPGPGYERIEEMVK